MHYSTLRWTEENVEERVRVERKESFLDFCPELVPIARGCLLGPFKGKTPLSAQQSEAWLSGGK